MAVPNRAAIVAVIAAQHPEAFPPGAANDPARLVLLRTIVRALNLGDNGQWGVLTKTDQGGKIPCDVLIWAPTRETVDCLTGTGACWLVQGVAPIAWLWTAVDPIVLPPSTLDRSVPVFYLAATVPCIVGTIVPQAGAQVVLINARGQVISVQVDGSVQLRDPGDIGGWELATRVCPTLLCYDGTGTTFYVPVQERPL